MPQHIVHGLACTMHHARRQTPDTRRQMHGLHLATGSTAPQARQPAALTLLKTRPQTLYPQPQTPLSLQMMQNLLLEEGDLVAIRSVSLPKGSFVKLQPHTQDFLDISNPRAVLEMTLRGFSCLTKGDCILMHYNNKRFYIDIVECRPQVAAPWVSHL